MTIVIPLIGILFVHRICIGALDNSPTNISDGYYGSSGDMMETIMSLHLDYCGYYPSCSSGFAFTEPEAETPVYPVPCCPPCSCLPTCTNHGNCCPDFEVGLQQNSSTVHDIEMSFQMLAARSENDNQTQGFSEETMDTENHLHTNFNLERMDRQGNSNRSNSTDHSKRSTDSKTAIHTDQATVDVRTTCVRPQVLVDINKVPDAYAYKMVTSCLNGYGNTSITAQGKNNKGITVFKILIWGDISSDIRSEI